MNIFFLMLPLLVVLSLVSLSSFDVSQYAYADTKERGVDYDKEVLLVREDGSKKIKQTFLAYDRVKHLGSFVDFVYTNFGNEHEIKTVDKFIRLDKNSCSFNITHLNGTSLLTDSILGYTGVVDSGSWNPIIQINNAKCETYYDEDNKSLVAKRFADGVGFTEYKYMFHDGAWKTQLEITNLSSLVNRVFGFNQIVSLNTDTAKFGNVELNLDSYDRYTFDRAWIEANDANVLEFSNGVIFDFDVGYDYLDSISISDNGRVSSELTFHFLRDNTIIQPNQTLIIDPTFTDSTSSSGRLHSSGATGTTCPAYSGTHANDQAKKQATSDAGSGACTVGYQSFDFSSFSFSTGIDSAYMTYAVSSTSGTPTNCNLLLSSHTSLGATMFNEAIVYGTTPTTEAVLQSTWDCSTGTTVNIDPSAFSALEGHAGDPTVYLLFGYSDYTRDGTQDSVIFDGTQELTIIYDSTPEPDAVDDLTVANLSSNTLDLVWSEPALNGETLINYSVNFTSPFGDPVTFLSNSTNIYYNVTGLTLGTDYSYRVSALTAGGYNFTGNILNVTTLAPTYGLPPTDLEVFAHGSTTQLDLEWIASGIDNILGYKIERETPKGTGWNTIVSNTTNTNTFYNNTGLSTGIVYNYRVTAINATGISAVSNEDEMTTFKLPDAVDDLLATASSLSDVNLGWSEPLHYAPNIIGYMVNFTSPTGDPLTVLTNNTFSSSVSYTVTGVGIGSDVSFRVAPITAHGLNASGNIANATTFSNFTIGEIDIIGESNTDILDVLFTRTDMNSTTTQLDVRYPNTVTDFRCDFDYTFAQINQTYSSLSSTVFNADYDTSSFVFNNATNEIIDVYCWDNVQPNVNGTYKITQQIFPFVTMINAFQNGEFKTAGQFGVLDFITVLVILISMIGFNRKNPAAGIIIAIMVLGATAFFGIIEFPTIIAGVIALIVMLAVVTTRKS